MMSIPKRVSRWSGGFSLVEVMVAVIVLCVGLLGIARMQSLALSSTSVANKRSLAAIEADSMAGAMHENRGYWTTSDTANATISITGTTLSFNNAPNLAAAGSPDCTAAGGPCTPTKLAAYDLNQWALALQALLPNDKASIACGAVTPISCTITIAWSENVVAVNAQQAQQAAANTAAIQVPTYTLYVQP